MIVQQFTPPISLKTVVDYIWVVDTGFLEEEKRKDIIMPLGHMNIILNFAANYMQIQGAKETLIPKIALIGQIKRAQYIQYGETLKQIGISLKPAGFVSLFDKPGIAFTKQITDAREIDPALSALYNDVEKITNTNMKVRKIYDFLEGQLDVETVDKEIIQRIEKMTTYIENNCAHLNISNMAECFYISISSLERFFKKYVGLTPKNYGEIYKFRKSIEQDLQRKDIQNLYYDQSHLIKKAKKLSGKTLKELENTHSELTLEKLLHPKDNEG